MTAAEISRTVADNLRAHLDTFAARENAGRNIYHPSAVKHRLAELRRARPRARIDADAAHDSLRAEGLSLACSYGEIAERAGLDGRTLRRLLAGPDAVHPPTWPGPDALAALAELLGVPWHELLQAPREGGAK